MAKLFNEFWGEAMGRVEKSNYHPKFDNDTEKEWHETMTDEVVFRSAVLQAFDSLALKVETLEEKVKELVKMNSPIPEYPDRCNCKGRFMQGGLQCDCNPDCQCHRIRLSSGL
jgi:hypothetical protein